MEGGFVQEARSVIPRLQLIGLEYLRDATAKLPSGSSYRYVKFSELQQQQEEEKACGDDHHHHQRTNKAGHSDINPRKYIVNDDGTYFIPVKKPSDSAIKVTCISIKMIYEMEKEVLRYLHHESNPQISHWDFKASNILSQGKTKISVTNSDHPAAVICFRGIERENDSKPVGTYGHMPHGIGSLGKTGPGLAKLLSSFVTTVASDELQKIGKAQTIKASPEQNSDRRSDRAGNAAAADSRGSAADIDLRIDKMRPQDRVNNPHQQDDVSSGSALLLLMAALVVTFTFHAACRVAFPIYKSNQQLKDGGGDSRTTTTTLATRVFIFLNSVGFIASASIIMVLLRHFPMKPWPQIAVVSLFGSYMCLIKVIFASEAWPMFFLSVAWILAMAAAWKIYGLSKRSSWFFPTSGRWLPN